MGEQRRRSGFAGVVGVERPTEGVSVRVESNSESQPAQQVPGGVPSGRERLRDAHCVRVIQNVVNVGNLARIGDDRLREDRIIADGRCRFARAERVLIGRQRLEPLAQIRRGRHVDAPRAALRCGDVGERPIPGLAPLPLPRRVLDPVIQNLGGDPHADLRQADAERRQGANKGARNLIGRAVERHPERPTLGVVRPRRAVVGSHPVTKTPPGSESTVLTIVCSRADAQPAGS